MANARQKKKKNAAAAKQAAATYKGKNAPIKPAAVKKPQETQGALVPEVAKAEIEKPEPQKPEPKKPEPKKPEPQKSEPKKPETEKTKNPKPENKKAEKKTVSKKSDFRKSTKPKAAKKKSKKSGSVFKSKLNAFGITKIAAVVLAISVVIASVCVIVWVKNNAENKVIPPEAVPQYNGVNISAEIALPVLEDEANQRKFASKMVREGDTEAFLYYASDELIFAEKNSQASLNLVNVSGNNCVLIASIVDEAGNICFSSRGLLPGRMLADIGINNQPYGSHEMTLVVAGYDPNTFELIGVQSSDLTVQVGIEEETSYVQEN